MPTFDKDILIKNIQKLIKETNTSQEQLEEVLHVKQPSISKCLNGKQSISIEFVYQIAHHFGVSIDYLCSDHSIENVAPPQEEPAIKPNTPAAIIIPVCSALAALFKSGNLRINEFDRQEKVYVEEIDDYGNELGRFYEKRGMLNSDPVNKYISIYFPNYDEIQNAFPSQAEANEYYCLLHEFGNALENNMHINEFLRQLSDLHSVYLKNSISTEAYHKAIDDNLAALIKIWQPQ